MARVGQPGNRARRMAKKAMAGKKGTGRLGKTLGQMKAGGVFKKASGY